MLLPHLGSLRLQRVRVVGAGLRVEAAAVSERATCPGCGYVSYRVHSRYVRRLTDAGIGGREMRLDLTVRRFFCAGPDCVRRTFVEQIAQLTTRYGRRTVLAADVVQAVAVALGGRPGSRLAGRLAVPVSRMTLLRVIRRLPEDPLLVTPLVLGVDDFAQRRATVTPRSWWTCTPTGRWTCYPTVMPTPSQPGSSSIPGSR
jgi:zinc-finger of transposase IS204/IS1001/IS1096/IS1165